MKPSPCSEAQKAFILRQGRGDLPMAEICRKAGISVAACYEKLTERPAHRAHVRNGLP